MANLKEVRTRIESVKSTRQITSAMKLVAASKLRKAQNAIMALRPYANKLQEIMGNVGDSISTDEQPYLQKREKEHVLIVVFTSNKGLCGAFNTNVIKHTASYIQEKYPSLLKEGKVNLMTIGKKATEYFKKNNYNVVENHDHIYDELSFAKASEIAEVIMDAFKNKNYDHVDMIYNKFINAASQEVTTEQFLPLESIHDDQEKADEIMDDDINYDEDYEEYIFEPDKKTITEEVIPKTLKIQFYKALLDSNASEHGARMTAMHQATENATSLVKELQLSYNKARQEAITNEILEVTTGAEALKG
ncbi:MAG: ATP synthase F1 subunit gamma [Bacteroidota bacterium]